MACEIAHEFGKQVATHSRSANSVKLSVRCGVDCIYHCEFADEEALDLMEAAKDRIFLGPAVGLLHNTIYEAEPWGITPEMIEQMGMRRNLEKTAEVYAEVKKRGIRVVVGGDYGFAWTPQGTNARDLQHFVNLFGYTPMEALVCATRFGGELMRRAASWVRSATAIWPTCCWSTAIPAQDIVDHGGPQPVRHDHEGRRDPQGPRRLRPRGQDRGGIGVLR